MDIIVAKCFVYLKRNFFELENWSQIFEIDSDDLNIIWKRNFCLFITIVAFVEFFYFDIETGNLEVFDDTDSDFGDDLDSDSDEEDEDNFVEEQDEPDEDFEDLFGKGTFYAVLICLLWIHYKFIDSF
ncbi:UNVERIFIED_CONTAM: hypothetical protein RMT77_011282 [Armadillidium vulgare]